MGSLARQAGLSQRNLLAGAAILGITLLARGGLTELANVGRFMGSQLGASLADALVGGLWSDVYRPASFGSYASPYASPYVGPFTRRMTAWQDPAASLFSRPWSDPVSAPGWGVGVGFGQPGGWGGCGTWGGVDGWAPW